MTFINIFHCFSEKIRLDVSSESSAEKSSLIFFERKVEKNVKMSSAAMFGALRVNYSSFFAGFD